MAEAAAPPKSYSLDPALYIYTSLTSGSSHIVTATSRLETILRANRVPFKALDLATDEKARMLWGRRAGKDDGGRVRKLPGLVQMGLVLGDLVEVEDWNEYGELKMHVKIYYDEHTIPSKPPTLPSKNTPQKESLNAPSQKENVKPSAAPAAVSSTPKETGESKGPAGGQPTSFTLAMRGVAAEAASKAKEVKKKVEPLVGVGKADPPKESSKTEDDKVKNEEAVPAKAEESAKKDAAIPPPITIDSVPHQIETLTSLQSPNSTAWKQNSATTSTKSEGAPSSPTHTIDTLASLQSPTSTTWKPAAGGFPVVGESKKVKEESSEEESSEEEEEEDDDDDDDEEDSDDD